MKAALKRKIKITAVIAGVLVILTLIVRFNLWLFEDKIVIHKVENYYRSDKDYFDEISSYFKSLYSDGLNNAKFFLSEPDKIELAYSGFSSEKNISDDKLVSALTNLQNKYRPNSERDCFGSVRAYYDEDGDMLLIIRAYSRFLKDAENPFTPSTWNLYLVYYDEGYTGYRSFLNIDDSGGVKRETFSGRWCTWAENGWIG